MAYTLSHQTPTATAISWSGVHIVYDGVDYAVADGNTTDKFVYWLLSDPTVFQTSNTYPSLSVSDAIVFINSLGIGLSVLESSIIEGSLVIPGTIQAGALAANSVSADNIVAGAITTDKIAANSVTALKIAAGSIETEKLAAGAITAEKIAAGTITADKLAANNLSAISADLGDITAGRITMDNQGYIRGGQTAYATGNGFFMGYSGTAYKFSIGDANKAMTWDGTTLTLTGDLVATGNIIANAVTNSISAYTAGSIAISQNPSSKTTIQTATILATGSKVFLSFAAQMQCGNNNSSGTGWFAWDLYRGATLIASGDTQHEYQSATGDGLNHSFAYSISDTPPAGSQSYTLRVAVTGSYSPLSPTAYRRSLTAIEMKR